MDQKVIIVAAPSGSGKTTIVKRLLHHYDKLAFSISACTRSARQNETDGIDYYFISADQFTEDIAKNAFIEWEMVYQGKYYGTYKSELDRIWNQDKTPLIDIDVKGAINLKTQLNNQAVTIFIQAPSIEILRERLTRRATETEEVIEERVAKASYELQFAHVFDYNVINDNLEIAVKEIIEIIDKVLL